MLRGVALVRTDVSEERSASFIGVTRIGELETTLAVTDIRHTFTAVTMKNAVVVQTPQETHYVSATEPSRLVVCKFWGFHSITFQ
jgi:hypothetical protein